MYKTVNDLHHDKGMVILSGQYAIGAHLSVGGEEAQGGPIGGR